MGLYEHLPYVNTHELNLAWILDQVKTLTEEWAATKTEFGDLKTEWASYKEYIDNYFNNLDVSQEISDKLDQMARDGSLDALILPYFNAYKAEINTILANQSTRMDALSARMDTFVRLPDGSTTGDAELADIRVGYNGETWTTAGDAVRGQIDYIHKVLSTIPYASNTFTYDGVNYHSSLKDRVEIFLVPGTQYVLRTTAPDAPPEERYQTKIFAFYTDGTNEELVFYTGPVADNEIPFMVNKTANAVGFFVDRNYTATNFTIEVTVPNSFIAKNTYDIIYGRPDIVFERGYWNASTGEAMDNPNTRSADFFPFLPSLVFRFVYNRPYNILYYDKNKKYLGYRGWNSNNLTYEDLIGDFPSALYFKLNLQVVYSNDINVNPDKYLIIRYDKVRYNTELVKYLMEKDPEKAFNGVYIPASGLHQNVLASKIGTLPYIQAFCKVGDKYYNTNGSAIAEMDGNFNILRTVSVNVGHANSFQIGADGYGYISGWDDNNLYKINMNTLQVHEIIPLPSPVSGYTTVAVDTVNTRLFIFWRLTYPDTKEHYRVSVYNYSTHTFEKEVRSPFPFAAMQGCDYHNGIIYIAYGLGSVSAPSGLAIFNTNLDVLGYYDLDVFAGNEPEGVCFDRETGKLYINDVRRNIYLVE